MTSPEKKPSLPGMVALRRGLVAFVLCTCSAGVVADAEPMYATSSVPLSASPTDQAAIVASIAVAAEVDRLDTVDGFHHVALEGWARAGAERVLFGRPGKRILVATIAKDQVAALQRVQTTVDPETDIAWNKIRLEGWIPQGTTEPRIDPIWAAAWSLFAERCTACHQRRVPEHYTANQWRSLIKVMGPRAGLPKADQALILAFLQNHASDTMEPEPARR